MWQSIITNLISMHYLWLIVLFTQFFIIICSKKESKKKVASKDNRGIQESAGAKQSKEPNRKSEEAQAGLEKVLSRSREDPEIGASGFNMASVKKFQDDDKSPQKTDLRSLEEDKFLYNPRNPLGDVKKGRNIPPKQQEPQEPLRAAAGNPSEKKLKDASVKLVSQHFQQRQEAKEAKQEVSVKYPPDIIVSFARPVVETKPYDAF
uniref:Uncharacterized protein n=1 Tax=Haemonchus contortus TaxID=6289 RepID=A0A7I4XSE0_HAECO